MMHCRRLILIGLLITLGLGAAAQTPALTTISDAFYGESVTLTITLQQQMTTSDGYIFTAGRTWTVPAPDGTFSIALPPNVGSMPINTSYLVRYKTPWGTYTKTWVVPSSATPVRLASVEGSVVASPTVMFASSQITPPSNCAALGGIFKWADTYWTCVSVLADPTSATGDMIVRGPSGLEAVAAGLNHYVWTSNGPGTVPTWQAAATGGGGTVTSVGLALPGIFAISGSPVTASGTLTGTLATQAANLVWAGPTSGVAAAPTFRALVAADIPALSYQSALSSASAPAHEFGTGFTAPGTFTFARPTCADLSDSAASCSTDTTNAANIASGTLPAARLPAPTATTLGGIESLAAASHKWIDAISTAGVPSATQPDFADLTGTATDAQLADAYSGTGACAAHEWASTLTRDAAPTCTQPSFADVSGSVAATQMPALTGDVTTTAGSTATTLANSGVTAGSCTSCNLTIDAKGRVTAQANGSGGGTSLVYKAQAPSSDSATGTGAWASFATTYSIPANTLVVGSSWTTDYYGEFNSGGGSPYFSFRAEAGSAVALTSNSFNIGGSGGYGFMWHLRAECVVTASGASGSAICFGLDTASDSTTIQYGQYDLVQGSAFTVDTTSALVLTPQLNGPSTWSATLQLARTVVYP